MSTEDDIAATDLAASERVPWRSIASVVIAFAAVVSGVILAMNYFVAERLPALTEESLNKASASWDAKGPASYDMDIELRGARPGTVHVEVRDKEVTAELRDGRVPGKWTWDTWSVPGMFDTLSQDLQTAADPEQAIQAEAGTKWRLRCEFDGKNGLPRKYHRLVTNGPEVFWQVTSFKPM
jgi:hypothetical protein